MIIAVLAIQHRATAMSNSEMRDPYIRGSATSNVAPARHARPYNGDDRLGAYLFRPATQPCGRDA